MDAPPASSDKIAVSWVISPELARASTNPPTKLMTRVTAATMRPGRIKSANCCGGVVINGTAVIMAINALANPSTSEWTASSRPVNSAHPPAQRIAARIHAAGTFHL